ncbi:piggyBac transposable element-derived protein 4-like [Cheilinus undulatus]|uniref:piggyBac transposable element-derived protein 4-like n=1 Tax=Cheilinus undulatus TaxID=241271 RepID=UPI001BD4637A|nr:piggyBac transposable element-derived protein 4-like [Cheilinus undulatus]
MNGEHVHVKPEDVEVAIDTDEEGDSGEESFYSEGVPDECLAPIESDFDDKEDIGPAAKQAAPSFEGPSTPAKELLSLPLRGQHHGQLLTRTQSLPHDKTRSRSRSTSKRHKRVRPRSQSPPRSTARSRSQSTSRHKKRVRTRSQSPPHGRARSRSRSTSRRHKQVRTRLHLPQRGRTRSRPRSTSQPRATSSSDGSPSYSWSRSRSRSTSSGSSYVSASRSKFPCLPAASTKSWNTESKRDTGPVPMSFVPARTPGHKLKGLKKCTPLDLFKLFISDEAAETVCKNTNKHAAKNIACGKKYSWTKLTVEEFFKFLGLTFFFALVKLTSLSDYWRKDTIFSQHFPPTVMSRDRYLVISWNIHMSDPDEDVENDKKKGTPDYDRLFRLKPLIDTIRQACNKFYHPRQNLSIDERVVATKAHTGMTQYTKAKPQRWGFKLFVLADSSNGYTLDYDVYSGKSKFSSDEGLAYDTVMSFINRAKLGSGYNLYVDNFYTSPKLFKDLYKMKIGACGTYRDNRKGCPRTTRNALTKNSPRGSIRWIREDPLVYVKWMDTREISVCSTIHEAFSGHTVQRRVNGQNDSVPCPSPIKDYNKNRGGVDLSDQLIHYYSVHHKTVRWYRTLFYHFLDIAATNSYILYKEYCQEKKKQPKTHRAYLEKLTAQLCGVSVDVPAPRKQNDHVPVPTSEQVETSKRASYGRKSCVHCRQTKKTIQSTPWKCKACDVALCIIANRNCFEAWHK